LPRRVVVQKRRIEFRKIDMVSAGKVSAAIHAIVGLLIGLIIAFLFGSLYVPLMALVAIAVPATSQIVSVGAAVSSAAGLSAIVIFPIVGAILGFLWGVIAAFLYNIVAMKIGGIEVETK